MSDAVKQTQSQIETGHINAEKSNEKHKLAWHNARTTLEQAKVNRIPKSINRSY